MNTRCILGLFASIILGATPLAAAASPQPVWTFDTKNVPIERNLHLYQISRAAADPLYDPEAKLLDWTLLKGGENRVAFDKRQYDVRASCYYAYGLLLTNDPADRARAGDILEVVLAQQDTRPDSKTRGVFLTHLGQNWETAHIDVNWADFLGVTLADIVSMDRQRNVLSKELRPKVENALKLAVQAVMRRDVSPNYTNIAILSSALGSAGAKLLGMQEAEPFAQTKMDAILSLVKKSPDGVFNEYFSPTYGGVDLYGAYLAQKFAGSPALKASAQALLDEAWRQTAASFHAPTLQFAGPNSRSYGDDMRDYCAILKYYLYLGHPSSYPIPDVEPHHAWDRIVMMEGADTPVAPRTEFAKTIPAWQTFTTNEPNGPSRRLFQYREGNFVLSTVEQQDEWQQRRNLVAYWQNEGLGCGGFQLGMCLDKSNWTLPKEPTTAWKLHFYSKQHKAAALVALVANPKDLPQMDAGCQLFFAPSARVTGTAPVIVQDGSVTAYIYPVTAANAGFTVKKEDPAVLQLARSWSTADSVGELRVLSYLVVFRMKDQPQPKVSGLSLKQNEAHGEAMAEVDGVPLSLSFTK